jgi:hypothetical protein
MKSKYLSNSGIALIVIGFCGLLLMQITIRPIARALVISEYERIGDTEMVKRELVYGHIHRPVFGLVDAMPLVLIPAGIMLVGALLVDWARRRETSN